MKKLLAFLVVFACFSVKSQTFFVGDTSCNYFKPNYTYTVITGIGHSQCDYNIDLDGDNIFDIIPSCGRSLYPAVPSQHGPIDNMSLYITSVTNVKFIYAPSTNTLCLYANTLKNMTYGSAIQSASNWSLTGNSIVYDMDNASSPFPFTRCGINTDTFYVAFKKTAGNNDTIFGWLLLDSNGPGKLISYAYRHAFSVSSSFSVSQDSLCIGDSLNLNSIGTGYFSGVGVKDNKFHATAVGNYQVYTSNGCINTNTLDITVLPLPNPQITNSSGPICQGDSLILTGNSINGIFSGNGVSGNVFHSGNIATNTLSINYTVSDQNNCTNTTSKTFSVSPLTYTMSTCVGINFSLPIELSLDSVFTGSGVSDNYYFDSNISGPGIIPINFTSLCNKTATLNMTVYPNPPAPQIINPITKCCLGDKLPMIGTPPGGFFQPTTSQIILVYNDTLFTEYFQQDVLFGDSSRAIISYGFSDNNGCTSYAFDTILVEYAYSPNSPISSCPNTTFSLTGYPTGGVFSGTSIVGNTYTAPSSIGYDYGYYNYTYPSGCNATYTLNLFTYNCVGIEETANNIGRILIYPNPAQNIIHLDAVNLNVISPYTVKIVSIDGKTLKTISIKENNNSIEIPDLDAGIYFVEANIDGSLYRSKFVIAK